MFYFYLIYLNLIEIMNNYEFRNLFIVGVLSNNESNDNYKERNTLIFDKNILFPKPDDEDNQDKIMEIKKYISVNKNKRNDMLERYSKHLIDNKNNFVSLKEKIKRRRQNYYNELYS
jgi:hypothetical protein